MELILGGILLAVGVMIGTALPIWVSFLVFAFFVYITVNTEELGQIFPMVLTIIITLGLIIGNISYAVQTDYLDSLDIGNPFVVEQTPKKG